LRAAHHNDLQTSLNLALGSAIATIGLTIPTLAAYSLWQGAKLALGISSQSVALLVLTLFISSVTLATGRTNILQGAVHLVILAPSCSSLPCREIPSHSAGASSCPAAQRSHFSDLLKWP